MGCTDVSRLRPKGPLALIGGLEAKAKTTLHLRCPPSNHKTIDLYIFEHSIGLNMASLQRIVISLLLIVTAGFLFLAQTSSAARGPKITNKVSTPFDLAEGALTDDWEGLPGYHTWR